MILTATSTIPYNALSADLVISNNPIFIKIAVIATHYDIVDEVTFLESEQLITLDAQSTQIKIFFFSSHFPVFDNLQICPF